MGGGVANPEQALLLPCVGVSQQSLYYFFGDILDHTGKKDPMWRYKGNQNVYLESLSSY